MGVDAEKTALQDAEFGNPTNRLGLPVYDRIRIDYRRRLYHLVKAVYYFLKGDCT